MTQMWETQLQLSNIHIDFCRLNSLTKTDSFPLPRIEDCIDRIGRAKYVTKFDLLKGYWQIPLTDRARQLSTPDELYQYCVMPVGMKNAPATFHRMINQLLGRVKGCKAYSDNVVVHSYSWAEHLTLMSEVFTKLAEANVTINLSCLVMHRSHFSVMWWGVEWSGH